MSSEKPLGRFPQPATKDSVAPKWPRAKGANAARVGLILLDSSLKPTYCNSEAFTIFAYPNQPAKTPNAEFSRSIRSIVGKKPGVDDSPTTTTHFVSGRRRPLCRCRGRGRSPLPRSWSVAPAVTCAPGFVPSEGSEQGPGELCCRGRARPTLMECLERHRSR